MKKSIAVLLLSTLCIQNIPVFAQSTPFSQLSLSIENIVSNLDYLIENNQVTITNYTGTQTDIVIPSQINGYAVTAIGHSAFGNKGLTSVSLPNTVRSIGENAFFGNNLTTVTLPENLETIEAYAFGSNPLTTLTLPRSLHYVSPSAFAGIDALHTIYVENDEHSLAHAPWGASAQVVWNAISADLHIKSAPLRSTYQEGQCFDPTGLIISLTKDHNLLKEVAYIGNAQSFEFSPSLDTPLSKNDSVIKGIYKGFASDIAFELPIQVTAEDFKIITLDNTATIVDYVGSDKEVVIPEEINGYTVTAIAHSAFNHKELTNVSFPSTVRSIGENAFFGNNLTTVTLPENLETIEAYAFGSNPLTTLTLPRSLHYVSPSAFVGIDALHTIYVENDEHSLAHAPWGASAQVVWNAISADLHIKSAPLRSTYQEGQYFDPTGLIISLTKDHNLLKDVAYIGNAQSFEFSPSLDTPLSRNDSVIKGIYKGFASDIPFELPIQVTAEDFKIITLDNTATIVDYIGSAKDVVIPEEINGYTVTAIGNSAFNHKGLTSVTLPNTVRFIGENAFWDNNLSALILPESLETIDAYAFGGNPLTTLILPRSVHHVSPFAFVDVDTLHTIYVENHEHSLAHAPWGSNAQIVWTAPY